MECLYLDSVGILVLHIICMCVMLGQCHHISRHIELVPSIVLVHFTLQQRREWQDEVEEQQGQLVSGLLSRSVMLFTLPAILT